MASIRIKRKSTESAYGSTTTLLPGELAVAGKWLWYGPKETSTDDAQVQARPVYSPTTLGDSGSILISNGTDLGWIKKGSEGQILTSTKDGISWANAPQQFSLSLNGIIHDGGNLSWYAPTLSGTAGQYLTSAGENGIPTWVDFPVSITFNGSVNNKPGFYAPIGSGTSGQMLYSTGAGKAPMWGPAPTFTDTNQKIQAIDNTEGSTPTTVTFGNNDTVSIKSDSGNIKISASSANKTISIIGPAVYDKATESGIGYYSVSYINSMFNTLAGQNEFIGVYTENDLTSTNIQSKLNAFVLSKAGRNSRNGDLVNIKNTTVYNGEQWRYDGTTSSWAYYIDWKDTTLEKATYTTLGGVKLGASDTFTGTEMASVPAGKGFPVLLNADGRMFANVYGYTPEPTAPSASTQQTVSVRKSDGTYETNQITHNVVPGSIVKRDSVTSDIYVPLIPGGDSCAASKKYVNDSIQIYTASTGLSLTEDNAFKAKLKDETANTSASSRSAATTNRLYSVEVDKDGYLAVTVPWTDNNTTYTGIQGVEITSAHQVRAKLQNYTLNTSAAYIRSETAGRLYPVELDSTGVLAVTVPWVDTNTTYTASTGLTLSGTVFKAKLRSETHNASASAKSAATAGRLYAVEVDKDGYLSVTVPWTDNNTTYTAGDGISISNTHVISVKYATTTEVGGFIAGTYTGENDSKTTALVMAPNGLLDISIDCGTWA